MNEAALRLECAKLALANARGAEALSMAREIYAFVTGSSTEREEPNAEA
jgi:hypothetical protein